MNQNDQNFNLNNWKNESQGMLHQSLTFLKVRIN